MQTAKIKLCRGNVLHLHPYSMSGSQYTLPTIRTGIGKHGKAERWSIGVSGKQNRVLFPKSFEEQNLVSMMWNPESCT